MSRLRSVSVPFVQGQNEGVDPKLLPDGVLTSLRNARFTKQGQLALRRGWRPATMVVVSDEGPVVGGTKVFQDLYEVDGSLVGLFQTGDGVRVATYARPTASTPWVQRTGIVVDPVTDVRLVGNVPDLPADVLRVSTALTADGVYGAVLQSTSAMSVLRVFVVATDDTLFYDDFTTTDSKLVSFGTTFGVVENTGSVLRLRLVTPTNQSPVATGTTTLVTATVTAFDAATALQHTNTPVGVHVAYVEAGAVKYAQFTSAGAQTGSTKTVVASAATRCAIASDDTRVHVVYDNGSAELQLVTFDATGAFATTAGPTAVNAGVAVASSGQFSVGSTSTRIFVASGTGASGRVCLVNRLDFTHVSNSLVTHKSSSLVGGFVFAGTGAPAVAVARGRSASSKQNDAVLVSSDQPWLVYAYGQGTTYGTAAGTQAPYFPTQTLAGLVLSPFRRLSDMSSTTSKAAETSGEAQQTRQARVSVFRSLSTERRPGAVLSGVLYISGGLLTEYIRGGLVENGYPAPVLFSLTESNSTGTIANGSYQYRALVTWTDRLGRVHRSPVSNVLAVTTTGANDTVTAVVHVAKSLRRDSNLVGQPKVELYRTEAGPGELFYLVATAVASATDDEVSLVDLLPDASLPDNRRLYTEGEFGAVSGALDIAPASASSYAAAARDRLVLGGADAAVQYSQVLFPDEPVSFAQPGVSGPGALVFQDAVEGRVTATFTLDDLAVFGTKDALFVVSLSGGPNFAGVGEFPSPSRLPSVVGVYDWRSVVENGEGVWFLGDVDKLYALPRGQGSPQYVGHNAEDLFASGETVGAARDVADHLLAWAVVGAGAEPDVLVVRDEREAQWSHDVLPFQPTSLVGYDDSLYATDSAGDVWFRHATAYGDAASGATAVTLVAETGDVQAFGGLAGWGRTAGVELLGEFQSAAAVLCEISYDSGTTWTSLGSHTVTGLSAGQAFQRQWYPANQRGGKFRLRFTMTPSSTTAEGCRLNGFSLFYTQRNGPTRLDSAKRR